MAYPKQMGFFDTNHPKSAYITIKGRHDLIVLTDKLPWPALIEIAFNIRESKVKNPSGPQPHYRELLGAVVLMSVRNITYRQAEDLIAHYAPARYLCGLMDSTWQPDHVAIFDFVQMLGPDGMAEITKLVLCHAKELGILDDSSLMSDTTAQEAMIPYPTEVGLMKRFTDLVGKCLKKVGGKFAQAKEVYKDIVSTVKGLVRKSHLFAKTKEQKKKIGKKLYHTAKRLQDALQEALSAGRQVRGKASAELARLNQVMTELFPQILHFLNTGFVAPKKIIHLQIPELYSIVRGKAGKQVEFGLKWGISRIDGFTLGFLINDGQHVSDKRFCIDAIKEHKALFGKAPRDFGFDRGGFSRANIRRAKKLGVKNVGIAPTGKAEWAVPETKAANIKRERVQVEGCIGTMKSKKFGFNKPNVHSRIAMEMCGHRAILGMNLCCMLRKLANQQTRQLMPT